MRKRSAVALLIVLALLAVAGCAQDVVSQMTKSTKVRADVMNAIASSPLLAQDMTLQLVANDSTRTRAIEAMLQDPRAAQYVLMDRLYLKAVVAYANADFAPNFGAPVFSNQMWSGRLRLMYAF